MNQNVLDKLELKISKNTLEFMIKKLYGRNDELHRLEI